MPPADAKMKSYVFLYPDIASPTISDIEEGVVPEERLAGFYQLRQAGWNVQISDGRWEGRWAKLRMRVKRYFHIPSLKMVKQWLPADVVVIKDDFSLALTILAKCLGKKVVYLDSMFTFPKSRLRNIAIKANLVLSDGVFCFSKSQADLWSQRYRVDPKTFTVLTYGMDPQFYPYNPDFNQLPETKIISIGRDVGRDFGCLLRIANSEGIKVILVTLPYLLPSSETKGTNVEVKERLAYADLFDLYRSSSAAAVPLGGPLTYPSGIRAVMEAMLLGAPVIASYTPVLAEYFTHGEDLLFVEAGSDEEMAEAIHKVAGDKELRERLIRTSRRKMESKYTVSLYAEQLKTALEAVANGNSAAAL